MSDQDIPSARARTTPDWRNALPCWLLAGLVLLFYWWTVTPEGSRPLIGRESSDFYNLLVRGFLKGQLSLDVPDDPVLATFANPYDPIQRAGHGLHDASYYKGKFYIYFGVTPAVVLFLPFKLLTGWFVNDNLAVLLFAAGGFLAGVALWQSIVRIHFPRTGLVLRLAGVLVLGLATMVPPLLRRPAMWEVPIAAGYCFFMLTLYCLWRAMARDRAGFWLAVASLTMGLCIGARPVYLLGAVMLLAPLGWVARETGRGFWRRRSWWAFAACALGPIITAGAGLALYNYLRFDNPLEFGQSYQMAGEDVSKMTLFSPRYFFYSLRVYLFSTPGLTPYFPFLTVISAPPPPPGQLGVENPYGILPGIPWVGLALLTLVPGLRARAVVGWWCAAVWAGVVATAGLVFCFAGVTGRYQVDFTPGLTLLGGVGALALAAKPEGAGGRRILTAVACVLALWSASFNVLVSLQHNRLLMLNHPKVYAPLAHAVNHLSAWLDRLTGQTYGPVELRVVFPRDAPGQVEPLVVTGRSFLADYLFVHYVAENQVRFGFEHTSRGGGVGPAFKIEPGSEHTVVVQLGSLYPPAEHPASDNLANDELRGRLRTVQVFLDDRIALYLNSPCYDATERKPSIGTSGPHRPGFKRDFSGRILGWRRLAPLAVSPWEKEQGALRLTLQLPRFTGRTSDPLLCTGETGRGDMLYMIRLDERHIAIGHDRWGYGGAQSEAIAIDPDSWLEVEISCPPLWPPGSPEMLLVRVGGTIVLQEEGAFHPSRPDQVKVGANPIGSSMAAKAFSGDVVRVERLKP